MRDTVGLQGYVVDCTLITESAGDNGPKQSVQCVEFSVVVHALDVASYISDIMSPMTLSQSALWYLEAIT